MPPLPWHPQEKESQNKITEVPTIKVILNKMTSVIKKISPIHDMPLNSIRMETPPRTVIEDTASPMAYFTKKYLEKQRNKAQSSLHRTPRSASSLEPPRKRQRTKTVITGVVPLRRKTNEGNLPPCYSTISVRQKAQISRK